MSGNIVEASSHPISSPRKMCQPDGPPHGRAQSVGVRVIGDHKVGAHAIGCLRCQVQRAGLFGIGKGKRGKRRIRRELLCDGRLLLCDRRR